MAYKQKSGSPFARNFGIGASPVKALETRITYPDGTESVKTGTASVVEAQNIAKNNAKYIDKQLGREAKKLGLTRGTDAFDKFASTFKPDTSNFKNVELTGDEAREFYSGANASGNVSDASNIFETMIPEGTNTDSRSEVSGKTLLNNSGGTVTTDLSTGEEGSLTYVDKSNVPMSTKKEALEIAERDRLAGN